MKITLDANDFHEAITDYLKKEFDINIEDHETYVKLTQKVYVADGKGKVAKLKEEKDMYVDPQELEYFEQYKPAETEIVISSYGRKPKEEDHDVK